MTNLLGIIVDIRLTRRHHNNTINNQNDSDLYDKATNFGRLKPLFSRFQFEVCKRRDLSGAEDFCTDRNKRISLRKAASQNAKISSESFLLVKCHCVTDLVRHEDICVESHVYPVMINVNVNRKVNVQIKMFFQHMYVFFPI